MAYIDYIAEEMIPPEEKDEWTLGEHIGESLQAILTEHAVRSHKDLQDLLKKIGLWPAPALLPYPLSKINYLQTLNNCIYFNGKNIGGDRHEIIKRNFFICIFQTIKNLF